MRPDAGLAGRRRDQGRGAGQGGRGPVLPARPARRRRAVLPVLQRQQAEPDAQPEARARPGGLPRAAEEGRRAAGELRPRRHRAPGLRLRRGPRAQPAPGLREHQGLRLLRALSRLQELRADRAGDGRGHERHRLPGRAAHLHVAVHRRLRHRHALRDRHPRRADAAARQRPGAAGRGVHAGRGGQPDPGEPARPPALREGHGAHRQPARRGRAGHDVPLPPGRPQRLRVHLRAAADVAPAAARDRPPGPDRRRALRGAGRPLAQSRRGGQAGRELDRPSARSTT